nr:hypothetical protein [Saprospiraceae bacterium]
MDLDKRRANDPVGRLTDPVRLNVRGTFKGRNLEEGGLSSPGDLQTKKSKIF